MVQNESSGKHTPSAKRPWRWTVIDTVILLLLVAVVAGVVYRAVDFFKDDRYTTEYHVSFTGTQAVYRTVPEQIGERDDVYLYDTEIRLGYIKSECMTVDEADEYGNVTYTGYFTVDQGTMKDGRLSVEGGKATIAVGDELVICTERMALSVRVEAIEEQIADRGAQDGTASVTDEAEADGTTQLVEDESEAAVADAESTTANAETESEEGEVVTTEAAVESESLPAEESESEWTETEETREFETA